MSSAWGPPAYVSVALHPTLLPCTLTPISPSLQRSVWDEGGGSEIRNLGIRPEGIPDMGLGAKGLGQAAGRAWVDRVTWEATRIVAVGMGKQWPGPLLCWPWS